MTVAAQAILARLLVAEVRFGARGIIEVVLAPSVGFAQGPVGTEPEVRAVGVAFVVEDRLLHRFFESGPFDDSAADDFGR